MILTSLPKQFSLKGDGLIYFQPDATNPLPGLPLARLVKGEEVLQPDIAFLPDSLPGDEDKDAVKAHVQTWLKAHIFTVLEPLFTLVADVTEETVPGPVRPVALKLFSALGVLPRQDIEGELAALGQEERRWLRGKKVQLGPLLVFLSELNKPAAVRLKALLWSLTQDQPLPAPAPRDGAMSVTVAPEAANPDFYRVIGYPVYGPRAVRIDMLDRVISAVYDTAKDGKFRAQHKMAEWMGCPIGDLYQILEGMGHRRIPAEEKAPDSSLPSPPAPSSEDSNPEPPAAAEMVATETQSSADPDAAPAKKKEPQIKPELDWFFLRRGKAYSERSPERQRTPRSFRPALRADSPSTPSLEKAGEKRAAPAPFPPERYGPKKKTAARAEDPSRFKGKPGEDKKDRKFSESRRERDRGETQGRPERSAEPRVFSALAATTDNPFAVLQSLKTK